MFSRFFNFDKDPFFSGHSERMKGFGRPILGERFDEYPSLWGLEPGEIGGLAEPRQRALEDDVQPRERRQHGSARGRALDRDGRFNRDEEFAVNPFGNGGVTDVFRDMNSMMSTMMRGMGNPETFMGGVGRRGEDGHGYYQSSVYSYKSNGEGQDPEVYEAHHSKMSAPGGLKEERKAVRDSKREMEKMSMGRHINERGHRVERMRNTRTNEQNQHQDFYGIQEGEVDGFQREWKEKASRYRSQEGRSLPERGQHHREVRGKSKDVPAISHL